MCLCQGLLEKPFKISFFMGATCTPHMVNAKITLRRIQEGADWGAPRREVEAHIKKYNLKPITDCREPRGNKTFQKKCYVLFCCVLFIIYHF